MRARSVSSKALDGSKEVKRIQNVRNLKGSLAGGGLKSKVLMLDLCLRNG